MRQQRMAAATKVATELFETEAAIDHALASISKLQAAMPEARLAANLSGIVGQDIALVRVRGSMVDVHGRLDELKNTLGLREMAIGGGMRKVPLQGQLAMVEQIAA
jgi:hypothetical protein